METIQAKSLLHKIAHGEMWFGSDYNMNLYRGCCHRCIYCDSRSSCYKITDFDRVKVKKDALLILRKELKSKRHKGVIQLGAMSDSYNPFEQEYEITRNALALIAHYGFGLSLETKSNLIVRDIDYLQRIHQNADMILKLTITAYDDALSQKIEPGVCVSSERFKALKALSAQGFFTGVVLSPILPFLTDTDENIKAIIHAAYENGASFVYTIGGVTLRENQRDYYYEQLDRLFPGLRNKYQNSYGNRYLCMSKNRELIKVFQAECEKYGLLYRMRDIIRAYKKEQPQQLTLNL
ncbi:radical SAM protein [bacterium c-19]|nr:radical SAM protein [bacterium c-19]